MLNLIILSVLIVFMFVFCVSYAKYEQNSKTIFEKIVYWLIMIIAVFGILHFAIIVF